MCGCETEQQTKRMNEKKQKIMLKNDKIQNVK